MGLKKGDKVAWQTSQGETKGRVVRKQTTETRIQDHKVAGSPEKHSISSRVTSRGRLPRTSQKPSRAVTGS